MENVEREQPECEPRYMTQDELDYWTAMGSWRCVQETARRRNPSKSEMRQMGLDHQYEKHLWDALHE